MSTQMTKPSPDLLPCPWQIFNKSLHRLARVNEHGKSFILCSCGCQGPTADDEGQAIGFWNTRAETRPAEEHTLLTIREQAARLNCSWRHLQNMTVCRMVPVVKLGRIVRYDPVVVQRAIDKLTVREVS